MKVIYLVGMGRSGSTLSEILLDSHSAIRGLGGMRRLAHYAKNHPCPCGAPTFAACEYWSEVDKNLIERTGQGLTTLAVNSKNPDTFAQANRVLFETAAEVANVPFVSDNSKGLGRLRALLNVPGLEVVPIHVLRDPRGRAYSVGKRRGYLAAIGSVWAYSMRSLRIYRLLRNRPHIVINYEKLAANPEEQLGRLMKRLDLEFEPQQLQWADLPHHNIGAADVLRGTDGSTIRPDMTWRNKMSRFTQNLISVLSFPARAANNAKERRWGLN